MFFKGRFHPARALPPAALTTALLVIGCGEAQPDSLEGVDAPELPDAGTEADAGDGYELWPESYNYTWGTEPNSMTLAHVFGTQGGVLTFKDAPAVADEGCEAYAGRQELGRVGGHASRRDRHVAGRAARGWRLAGHGARRITRTLDPSFELDESNRRAAPLDA